MNQSACVGGTVNFTCVVMFTSGSPSAASWFTSNGNVDAITLPGHTRTDDSNGRSAPANVTTVLTVTNVLISDNGTDYTCVQGLNERSDTVFLTVFGEFHKTYVRTCMYIIMCIYVFMCVSLLMCVSVGVHRVSLTCNQFHSSTIALCNDRKILSSVVDSSK